MDEIMPLDIATFKPILLGVILAIFAYTDWKYRRVHNILIFLGMCAGFYFSYEAGTLTKTIVSTLITFAFFFAFWIFGGIAEGDVKVLTMIGCFSGFWQTAEYLIVASVLSLIWVLLYKARYKRLREGIPLVSFLFVSFVFVQIFQAYGMSVIG